MSIDAIKDTTPAVETSETAEKPLITCEASALLERDEEEKASKHSLKKGEAELPAETTLPDSDVDVTSVRRQSCKTTNAWQSMDEAVVGLSHRDVYPVLPCQDAAYAVHHPRPAVIVADGAGSSSVSEIGADAVAKGLGRLLKTLESPLAELLDHSGNEADIRQFALLLVKHARGLLEDLALQHRRPVKDFRCTLLVAITGKENVLWLKVGDGVLVAERIYPAPSCDSGEAEKVSLQPERVTLGEMGKGEFANQTTFVDESLMPDEVQSGLISAKGLSGLVAISDGAAEKLVANDGSCISQRISVWLEALRHEKLKRRVLTKAFYSEDFNAGTTGDDRSIALVSCGVVPEISVT
ncbi:MAG: protein phosphatase 2C domain-containing protein [Amphritea sp.]